MTSPLGLERWVRVSPLKSMTKRIQSRGTTCAKFLKQENLEYQRKKGKQKSWKSRQWPLSHVKESGLYVGDNGRTAEEFWAKVIWSFRNWAFSTLSSTAFKKDNGLKAVELLSKITLLSLFHSFKLSIIYIVVVEMSKNEFIFLGRMRSFWNLYRHIRRKEMLLLLCHKNNCSFPRFSSKDS